MNSRAQTTIRQRAEFSNWARVRITVRSRARNSTPEIAAYLASYAGADPGKTDPWAVDPKKSVFVHRPRRLPRVTSANQAT